MKETQARTLEHLACVVADWVLTIEGYDVVSQRWILLLRISMYVIFTGWKNVKLKFPSQGTLSNQSHLWLIIHIQNQV